MTNSKEKNGKIEFLRLVFCICVVCFHYYKYVLGGADMDEGGLHLSFFPNGAIAVEFFFIVSGFLMGKSIYKSIQKKGSLSNDRLLSKDYVRFMGKKILAIFPYHIVGFIIVLALKSMEDIDHWTVIVKRIVNSIPCFFLLDMSGVKFANPNLVEWYISAMLISMAIIYPIARKCYYRFTRYWAPIIAILFLGSMVIQTKNIVGDVHEVMFGSIYKGLIKAFAEICLGLFAFELCRFIDTFELRKSSKLFLTMVEILMFIITIIFTMMTFGNNYWIDCLFAVFVLIVLSFSSLTYGSRIFNNKFFYYLGSLSLPIYLCHYAGILLLNLSPFNSYDANLKFLSYLLSVAISTIIVKIVGKQIYKISFVKAITKKLQSDQ